MNQHKLKVAILGSGNIGTDLLIKINRSKYLQCTYFIGRNLKSKGMHRAISLGVPVSDKSIETIVNNPDCCDLVFDATSAHDHRKHAMILKNLGKIAIDLTPAKIGMVCIPSVNLQECLKSDNINMITCGGQSSVPLIYQIAEVCNEIEYVEIVSTISSKSAGPATRLNIDEYIDTTENAIKLFSGCRNAKAILNLNPAEPCINMKTTIYLKARDLNPHLEEIRKKIDEMVTKIQEYVPGYKLIVPPVYENDRLMLTVQVVGLGDYLPAYAGNLDIINSAAIAAAEAFAKARGLS